jgi:hypothetical protein
MTSDELELVTQKFLAAVEAQVAWGTPRAEVEAWLRQVACLCSKGPERDAALLDFISKGEAAILDRGNFIALLPPAAWRLPEAPAEPSSPVRAPSCRLKIEGNALAEHGKAVVLLDFQVVRLGTCQDTRQAQLCLLRHLLAANGEWRTRTELNEMEKAAACWLGVHSRWDRTIQRLPKTLRDLVESSDKGYRLHRGLWHG